MWLTDMEYLWNNKKKIYGTIKEVFPKVGKNEKILPIGKPSRHRALTKEEFIDKMQVE